MKNYIYFLAIINFISFSTYGIDKMKAKQNKTRIREATLFFLSIIGAPAGSLFGMFFFHHKTKKVKFYIVNILMLAIWIYITYRFLILEV